jgi:hypothetical protein
LEVPTIDHGTLEDQVSKFKKITFLFVTDAQIK